MPTNTTNYSLLKPLVNDPTDQDLWGGYLNTNMDTIDAQLKVASDFVYAAKSANYTVLTSDRNKLITFDATAGSVTATLPAAASAGSGFTVAIKKLDSSANAVVIDGNASETIDGATTVSLTLQYDTVVLVCDGTNWQVMSRNRIVDKATQADMEAETANKYVSADVSKYAPSAAKAFVRFTVDAGTRAVTILRSYNVASVVRNSTGYFTITFTNAMSDDTYSVVGMCKSIELGGGAGYRPWSVGLSNTTSPSTTSFQIVSGAANVTSLGDPADCSITVFGDM